MNRTFFSEIVRRIDPGFRLASCEPVMGGCIHEAWQVTGGGRRYFVKTAEAARLPMFAAEAEGLRALAETEVVRVPAVLDWGCQEGKAFLILEWLPLTGRDGDADARLGECLARLHRVPQPRFGWPCDNFIGATPQHNGFVDDWIAFWRRHRLGYQLALAARRGYGGKIQELGERLLVNLDALFSGHRVVPSLLHGDLWSGNAAALPQGDPVVYDPACYWGDREADVAMTELFGGFDARFHAAYQAVWPLDPGYPVRRDLYNLYHVLNHLNLFGDSYRCQAEALLMRLMAEIR